MFISQGGLADEHMDQVLIALFISFRYMRRRTTVMWFVLRICRMLQELRIVFPLFMLRFMIHFATQ